MVEGSENIPAGDGGYPSRASGYLVMVILMVAYTFAIVDRVALSLVIDPIRAEFSLTDTQISFLAGPAFVIFFVIFSFPFGRWVDVHSRRTIIAIGTMLWSIAMIICGLANSVWQMFIGRMGVGSGEASINPAAYSIIPDYFPPDKRGFATGIYVSGTAIGGGGALYLGGLLLDWAERTHPVLPFVGQLAPWKILFLSLGVPGFIVGLLILFLVGEPTRRKIAGHDSEPVPVREAIAYLYKHGGVILVTFIAFAGFAINNYAYTVWGPAYFMRVHHFTAGQVGLLFGLCFGVAGFFGMMLGGHLADMMIRRGHPEAPIWVGLRVACVQLPLFVASYLIPDGRIAAVIFGLAIFSVSLITALQGNMVQVLVPNRMRGQAAAVFLSIVNLLGLGVAPTLTALMTDYVFGGPMGLGKSLAVTSVLSLGMLIILLSLTMKKARIHAGLVQDA